MMTGKGAKPGYVGVPTNIEPEKNDRTKRKYVINRTPKGDIVFSKTVLFVIILIMLLLLIGAVLLTYFLVPGCTVTDPDSPEALMEEPHDGGGRLPRNVFPTSYRLQIQPFLEEGNFTTKGSVVISLNVSESTYKITLNAADLNISQDLVEVYESSSSKKKGKTLKIIDQTYNNESEQYTVSLEESLEQGKEYVLSIHFTGRLNDKNQGFYRSSYTDWSTAAAQKKYIASTQFSPVDARRAFPCFDEPDLKAKFTISVARPRYMNTRSNMEIRESVQMLNDPEWYWDHFYETPKMSTYLVAFVVSELRYYQQRPLQNNITFLIFTRDDVLSQSSYAGKIGTEMLQYYENLFSTPFPLSKIDIVALPDFGFTAMENWGLITFRESGLLYDDATTSIERKRSIATVFAHELSHQWFGNLVTPKWWDDLWLKEGFATYFKYFGVHFVESEWLIMDEILLSEAQPTYIEDSLASSHPVSGSVTSFKEIRQQFDEISYSKGALLIRMMNGFLGDAVFKAGLVRYLRQHAYQNADHDDLFSAFEIEAQSASALDSSLKLKDIMDTWILQAGFPVITVIRNYEKRTASITQERFLFTNNAEDTSLWYVPISYSTNASHAASSHIQPTVWLKKEASVELTDIGENAQAPLLVNPGGKYYYRVNYDLQNWQLIERNILTYVPTIQAQLIDDAMNLARGGRLPYSVPLNLAMQILPENHYVPVAITLEDLGYLDDMLVTTAAYGQFQAIIGNRLDKFPFTVEGSSPSGYSERMLRIAVLKWICKQEESSCVTPARKQFRMWQNPGSTNDINPDLRYLVYCTAIREGGKSEWNFAYEQYLKTESPTEKTALLEALGCTSQTWLLHRYLNWTISRPNEIRKQDGKTVFNAVSNNVIGHSVALQFVTNNWNEIKEYYGEAFNILSSIVSSLPKYMNTKAQLNQLREFRDKYMENLGTARRAVYKAIDAVKANIAWYKANYEPIQDWLTQTIVTKRIPT